MDSMVDSKERNQSKISQKRNFWMENWEADVLPLNYSRNLFKIKVLCHLKAFDNPA